jgi:TolB-like protein/Flp pilus assembly protein TadD
MVASKKVQKNSKSTRDLAAAGGVGFQRFIYEFGAFRLDEKERLLFRNGTPISLTPKVFDLLLLLVQRSNSLVEKETILSEIWPDAFVEEANLSVNVATLRKALGEVINEFQYIETVPKRGYRFLAKVRKRKADNDRRESAQHSAILVSPRQTGAGQTVEWRNSLAVLPFQNGSNDPNAEYLSDGVTESIINNLSQLSGLRVVARNSVFRYKQTKLTPASIARHLDVRLIVSGRILQLGDRVIIRTELVDVADQRQLWGGQFHRKLSDVLSVQNEISEEISKALKFQLTREERNRLTKHYTDNSEAYHLYLKGRYYWNTFSQSALRTAVNFFSQAIALDPTYALAYAGLADCYYRLSNVYAPTRDEMPKAKAAAMKALDIDPNLSEAHAALGLTKLFQELDWAGAEKLFRRAIEINPNYSIAHQRLGLYFNLLGRFAEAEEELDVARQIDPLSLHMSWSFALMFFLARDFEQALSEAQTALEMDSNYVPTLYVLGRTWEQLGQLDRAVATFEHVLTLNDSPTFLAALGHAYATAGNRKAARRILQQLELRSKSRYVSAYAKAVVHVSLGETNQAFASLERACDEGCEMITWLKVDPAFDVLRYDVRFSNLLKRLGLHDDYFLGQATAS